MAQNTSLVLLDDVEDWEGESRVIAHWIELNVPESHESIPRRMEDQSLKIKTEYLAWVHDLRQTSVNGKTLISTLNFLDGLSYWWMTSIAVKSPFENDCIHTIFKLRALEKLYLERGCKGLIYYGNNLTLDRTLQGWAKKLGHNYKKFRQKKKFLQRKDSGDG